MRKNKTLFLSVILIALVCAVGGLIYLRVPSVIKAYTVSAKATATPEPVPEPKSVIINYLTPLGTISAPAVNAGEKVVLEQGPVIENYTFLHWTDANGNIETRTEIYPEEDTWYSAVYTVALNCKDHIPYLSADENGLLNLDGTVSRRELAEAVYSLLSVKINGTDKFDDVPADDSCAAAVSALKSLNIISGSRFRPDDPATARDVLSVLCSLYPNYGDFSDSTVCSSAESFGWITSAEETGKQLDEYITRAEFAGIFNIVLNRRFNGEYPGGGTEQHGNDYCNVLEACTIHSYTIENGDEKWTEYQALKDIKPGFMLVDYTLYYVNENRTLLKNSEIDGFAFDADGRYTSGDTELDELVRNVIAEYWQDDGDMISFLHRIFNHLAFDSTFISSKHFYSAEEIPTVDLAKRILSEGKGNCYNYSAAFIQIVRSLGYDASWVIGNVRAKPGIIEHGWVQMPIDGEIFYFDPEMEPICKPKGLTAFMMTEQRSRELGFLIVDGNN